jgi:hypothetical protein
MSVQCVLVHARRMTRDKDKCGRRCLGLKTSKITRAKPLPTIEPVPRIGAGEMNANRSC